MVKPNPCCRMMKIMRVPSMSTINGRTLEANQVLLASASHLDVISASSSLRVHHHARCSLS